MFCPCLFKYNIVLLTLFQFVIDFIFISHRFSTSFEIMVISLIFYKNRSDFHLVSSKVTHLVTITSAIPIKHRMLEHLSQSSILWDPHSIRRSGTAVHSVQFARLHQGRVAIPIILIMLYDHWKRAVAVCCSLKACLHLPIHDK